ncbi:hypothetical protein [Nocardioides sp.]|uniref:hypothetical protein n=1 Tax=Nocardioides sp. TaxID=35761 RepID=UPI00262D53E1|nr:hypothetical protein [Nocardioides sp.]
MTRLLDRLEHALERTSLRTTAGRHRRDSSPRIAVARLIAPAPRTTPDATTSARPAGFTDCRGEWHAWEDAS